MNKIETPEYGWGKMHVSHMAEVCILVEYLDILCRQLVMGHNHFI